LEQVLKALGVSKRFGGLTAVDKVDLAVKRGTIHGLIGPNGSGKTTFLNLVNGIYPSDGGRLILFGKDVSGLSADKIARFGVARTFQNVGLFRGLSVLDNARSGHERHNEYGLLGALIRGASMKRSEAASLKESREALKFVGLDIDERDLAGSLPYGHQRLLELARALVLRPKLLLLDEPVAGMPPKEIFRLAELIREIKKLDVTILLVEHNMEFMMGICDEITVLNGGRHIAQGTPLEIQNNPAVLEAYLGSTVMEPLFERRDSSNRQRHALLEMRNLSIYYGEVQATRQISLEVLEGEITAIMGPNGAGKSTTLRAISGLLKRIEGEIRFEGRLINNFPAHRIASLGISHVPEGRRIFPGLTVYENLEVASTAAPKTGYNFRSYLDEVYDLFPVLKQRSSQLGWSLSGGEQQMLAIARGLIPRPKILLLDEPSLGLAPKLVEELFRWIQNIHERGTSILIVEQNLQLAMALARRGYLLVNGEVVISGTTHELMDKESVRKAYLGEEETKSNENDRPSHSH